MMEHKVVSREAWLKARKEFLVKEKEFTKLRDQLSQQRRELPWVKVEKDYVFDGPNGMKTLSELFENRSQLLVYHFMFDPSWSEGCKSCSFWADNFNGIIVHLNHRDMTMVAISRAPLPQLESYQQHMGWDFKWLSSFNSDFNYDYQVSFTEEARKKGNLEYNYVKHDSLSSELPGLSVFYKDENGNVFHTYSSYARGLDMVNGAYHFLDLLPKGRDEAGLSSSMAWLRRHDQYDPA
jgi:predicted dithiol-disulfide oxidoreductase (DUF899 family)